jgi:hypothetical protein
MGGGDAMKEPAPTFLISRRRLAERWGVSLAVLKAREKSGILPTLRINRHVRYRVQDIEYIESAIKVPR